MTERIYYDDPYSREFDATVVRVEPRDGDQAVWLDRSSFYPTSGGQPFDTGAIDAAAVVDVIDEDGEVVHVVRGGALQAGARVHGRVDWTRRFDHMQQHTGQHVLSAAFVRFAAVPTVSFHLGAELSTIDLDRDVTAGEIRRAEDEANQVVWQDRLVSIRYADAGDAVQMGLRKASTRSGTLRLIDIEDFDLSACGGSHVRSTGAIGLIAVTGWERFKGGVRVSFACGRRALGRHRMLRDVVDTAARQLSVQPGELPAAVERLLAEGREHRRAVVDYERELARHRAATLAAEARSIGGVRMVIAAVGGDAAALKALASAIVSAPGYGVVLFSDAAPSALVVARSADVTGLPCDAMVRSLCARFGGRGGGRPDLAQAGGLNGAPDEMIATATAVVAQER